MRISRAVSSKIDNNGNKILMRASLEDPSQPDVIHQRIIRAVDYIAENSEGGSHEQQHARSIIIFLYACWEDEIRPRLATAKDVKTDQLTSDIMGDLRLIRHAILHTKAILQMKEHRKLKKLGSIFSVNAPLIILHKIMHKIFILIKQDVCRLVLEYTGQENGPVKPEDICDIAIQHTRATPKTLPKVLPNKL